jgi:hypothetical protein
MDLEDPLKMELIQFFLLINLLSLKERILTLRQMPKKIGQPSSPLRKTLAMPILQMEVQSQNL